MKQGTYSLFPHSVATFRVWQACCGTSIGLGQVLKLVGEVAVSIPTRNTTALSRCHSVMGRRASGAYLANSWFYAGLIVYEYFDCTYMCTWPSLLDRSGPQHLGLLTACGYSARGRARTPE